MEINVDRKLIRSLREKRAWSQEHLAQVSGLSLRTVQRVEASGLASYESAKAIASVLEIPVQRLTVSTTAPPRRRLLSPLVKRVSVAIASAVVAGSAFFATGVLAKDVKLSMGIFLNDEQVGTPQVITSEGKDAEVRIDGVIRLVIVPTVQPDGSVLLAATIYESKGKEFVLLSSPIIAVRDKQAGEIRLASNSGKSFRVRITPAIQ